MGRRHCRIQIWIGVFVQVLQLRSGAQVPTGSVQRLPNRDLKRPRDRTNVRTGEVLGFPALLQARRRAVRLAQAEKDPGGFQVHRRLQSSLHGGRYWQTITKPVLFAKPEPRGSARRSAVEDRVRGRLVDNGDVTALSRTPLDRTQDSQRHGARPRSLVQQGARKLGLERERRRGLFIIIVVGSRSSSPQEIPNWSSRFVFFFKQFTPRIRGRFVKVKRRRWRNQSIQTERNQGFKKKFVCK